MKTRFFRRVISFAVAFLMALGVFTILPEECLLSISTMISAVESISANNVVDSGTCGENITWTLDNIGVLTISGMGKMADWAYRNSPWYSHRTAITSIVIENGVTSISGWSFLECTNITSAFISDSVTSIGFDAFDRCTSLTNITIPSSVTSINNSAFAYCTSLSSIVIPNSVTSIGSEAFVGCTSLTNITIPGSVTSIDSRSFADCTSLSSIKIQEGVKLIDSYAFANCTSLISITIPSSITEISVDVFKGCSAHTNISVNSNNAYFSSENGILFNKNKTSLLSCPDGISGNYVIPSSVTSIAICAFSDCTKLTSIKIPNSVNFIDSSAFEGCTGLINIEIPYSVTSIFMYTFYDCTSLKSITIPNSVTSVGHGSFENCTSLESIIIPDSVTSIGYVAFENCTSLKSITILNSCTSIDHAAFVGCDNLTIYGYANTNVETYAKENNIPFVALDESDSENLEEDMLNLIEQKSKATVLEHIYIDMDKDGAKEMIAVVNSAAPNNAYYDLWYCSSDKTNCNVVNSVGRGFEFYKFDSISYDTEAHVIFNCGNNMGNAQDYVVLALHNKAIEIALRSSGFATVTDRKTIHVKSVGYDPYRVETEHEYKYDFEKRQYIEVTDDVDENTDTSSDSRYDYLYLDFKPKNLSYTYSADTESFNAASTECEINLSCLNLLQNGLFMDVNKIVVTPPKGFSINGKGERVPHEYTYIVPEPINGGSDGDISEHFVLYTPTKDFLKGNPIKESSTEELTITVYGDDDFVKTFKQEINIKRTSASPKNAIDVSEEYDETDTDGDGLPDVWETNGIVYNGEFLNLPAMGANPEIPDIFVEVDWMEGLNPKYYKDALYIVSCQFEKHGLNLHIDAGSDFIDYANYNKPWGELSCANVVENVNIYTSDTQKNGGTTGMWKNLIDKNFNSNGIRSLVFRHCIMGNKVIAKNSITLNENIISGISSGIPHQYFIVSLGYIMEEYRTTDNFQTVAVAGTFMHELGHTLGLHHGGINSMGISSDTCYKPNYLSIMNYSFQTRGLVFNKSFTDKSSIKELVKYVNYSEFSLPALNESVLYESLGVDPYGVTEGSGIKTIYYFDNNVYGFQSNSEISKAPIDFNNDGTISTLPIMQTTRRSKNLTDKLPILLLDTTNDWLHIKYKGGAIGGNGATLDYLFEIFNTDELVFDIPEEAPADELFNVATDVTDEFPVPPISTPDTPTTSVPNGPTTTTPNIPSDSTNANPPTNSVGSVTQSNITTSTTFNVKVENKITNKTIKAKATRTGENVTINLGKDNNGYYANAYTLDGKLLDAVKIKSGKVKFTIPNDIDFYIIVDEASYLDYEDVSSGAGIYDFLNETTTSLCIIVIIIIAIVGSLSIVAIKRFSKNKH